MCPNFAILIISTAWMCPPVYCKYPGTIDNGDVLLVGRIGKYEYRPYVKRIGHNDQIEFHCHKGYKRVGPAAQTCVDQVWSPPSKPKCVPKQHPKLSMMYVFRGRRSVGRNDTSIDYDKGEKSGHTGSTTGHLRGTGTVVRTEGVSY